jgi:WD40 repeat protein
MQAALLRSCLSSGRRILLSAHSQHKLLILQSNPLKQLQLRGHDDEVTAFAMSPNGAMLATGQKGKNSDVIIWNTQTLTQQFRFQEHDFEVVAVAFSHDSKLLATIGNEV